MTAITGSNGNDLLTGTAGSDTINSGNGDDSVYGGAGNDSLNGGAGDDTLDGGSGSDQLNGGSGNDTLIYNVSENIAAGTKDVYTGGAGVDTLQLLFTRAQWLESSTQTQIAAYLAHLAAVTNARTGEVSNGSASDFVFSFGSSTLTVQMTETLRILVDGVEVNPANEAVKALGDAVATTEDGPGIQIHVLQNDLVPDLVKSLALASAPAHGTATLVQPAMGDPSTWYFQYQPHAAAFQYLAAGESATDTFSYEVKDADGGTGLATVTITITGSNDGPVITAQDLAGAVSEQAAPAGTLSDSGIIGFSDLDLSDVHLVSATGTPVGSVLGSLTAVKNADTTGTGTGGQLTWTYTVNATAVEYLAAGQTRVESFTITVNDQHGGIVTRQIDVTITGTNDAPTIGAADAAAAVTEDAATPTLSDSGTITFDDVDLSDAHGVSVAAGPGNTLGGVLTAGVSDAATGAGDGTVSWNYSVANAATQHLAQGQTATETFTVSINDGHGGTVNQQITVTVTGTNDVPVIGGVASGAVSEDASTPNLSTSGALTIADVDAGQSNFAPQASTAGSNGHGSFTLAANGNWSYTASNGQTAIQQLGAGQSISDSFTAVSSDGTASQVVTVTITGTNDVPVIGGVASGAVSEDASTPNLSTSGALTIADVDAGQSNFAPQASTAGSNGHGSFTLAANGAWTYTANNSQAAIQQLGAGQSLSDSFTAVSSDGTASQVVTVTITGTNDVPVIGGVASGAVTEDASTPNLSTSGALTIADVDTGQSSFTAQAGTAGSNGYGSFALAANGNWTYTANNSQAAIQQLAAGQSINDSFTAVSSDGTACQLVTVTITGTNDVPVIDGAASGTVSEDASTPNLSTSGALTIADVDAGQSSFTAQPGTAGSNGHGNFTLAADGSWSYTANNSQAAIQQLGAGQSISDSFTAVSSDGTASQLVTVTITGTNDVPLIGGVASGAVQEDLAVAAGNLATGGALTIADVDAGQSSFTAQAGTAGSNGYGSFTLAVDGNWTYTADNSQSAIQQLGAGQSIIDSFTAVSSDGTASQLVTVTITGTNDVPVIGGVATGAVTEDASTPNLSTGGALTIADVDQGQSNFAPQASTGGTNGYGNFTLAADGTWAYTADNSQSAIQQLGAGQSLSDSFTAVSSDGTASQLVTVTITGTNDVPVIGGIATGAVSEDASTPNLSASGALTIADVDAGQSNFVPQASTAGSNGHGNFTLAADGSWTYMTNNGQAAIQQLGAGQSISDSFTAVSSDGTASQMVTVTITGTNDVPVIGGVASGALSEDASTSNLSTGGALTIADVDQGQSNFAPQASTAGSNGYGSFSLLADGSWSYTADNGQAAIQQLGAGESISDSFTAVSSDGTASQAVTVTITGTNDIPVIGGVASGAVSEDASTPNLSTSGALTIADVDQGQSNFAPQASTAGSNGYGSFNLLADGSWSYTADNSQAAIQQLGAGESISDSFTAVSSDGTASQVVTVTITGTNDVPVIGGVASGAVSEDVSTPNLSTGGALTIADVDQGQSNFAPQASTGGSNGYGNFNLLADGSWSYTADNSQSAIQQLGAGESISDSFTAVSSDGTASQVVTVTITGTNDVPVIGGVASGAAQEDIAVAGGSLAASGALTIADVDQGQSNFAPQASTGGTNGYGNFTLAADGSWSYTANNSQAAIQQLGAGQSINDSFTAVSSDGTASQVVTVTITGTNDVPVIGGVATGAVSEDASTPNLSTSGALTIADVDAGQSSFAPQASTGGSNGYGNFTLAANGTWTYTANNSQAAIQQLGAGQSIIDSFTAVSSDGTASQLVTVTITGTNDVPVIGGAASGAAQEDVAVSGGNLATSGTLTIADVDAGQSNFAPQASTAGGNGYGSFTLAANGAWTYTANNSQAAIQQLGAGQSISDSFTAVSSDGTASQLVTVTITGTNDVPVIAGVASGAVTEDASTPNLSTSGALTIVDVDAGQSSFTAQAGTAGSNGYGSFTLAANGNWTYTANNGQAEIQQLAAGQSISDSFTAVSSDGTASRVVTVTIAGTNDAPVLSAAATPALASVNEDAGAPVGAVGTLVSSLVNLNPPAGGLDNVTDADNGAITGIALTGVNATNGSWWYSTNGGANWAAVGAVSGASALLLAADANTRVYFQANSNFSGTVSDGITFRAWDQTSGAAGATVSTVTNGNSSAFSSATDTASITVIAVNDNPVAVADRIIVSNSTLVTLSVSSLLGNDTDIDGLALTITSVGGAVGISGLTLDATNGTISFTSGSTAGATAGSFQYTVSDGAGGTTTATATIDIRAVSGGNGADTIDLGATGAYQASFIDGRGGADDLTGGVGGDVFIGGSGNGADTLLGASGNDLLIGGDGNDTLSGGAGNDVLRGGLGSNDSMDGGDGSEDLLDFSDGSVAVNFTLVQSAAPTSIVNGTAGLGNNDTYQNIEGVIGTGLADTLTGSASNDIIRGGAGNDTLDGAGGTGDLLDFSDGTAGLTFTLTQSSSTTSFNASAAGLGIDGYKNFEGVIGTAFGDTITGSASNDQLRGGGGNDVINGLAGDDRIVGGTGADLLTGGADNDTFVFDSAPNAVDSVTDFNASGSAASGDLIELSRGTFTALTTASGSTLSAAEFASLNGGGAGDTVGAGVHVIYDSATGNLYYDADGLGAANRTLVATLTLSNPADTFDSNDIKAGV
ncbi:VCBS domain-containing protein [Variovorax sp. KBS0712]|uniref:VCBS domain-containing protein n=1 Tax=Variovorax sp. KBS0712 TaxID=2578111 RepID=UPI0026BA2CC5|nr:VCBS domain-containing protein [Variovorax sp. KBS0712]